MRPLNAIIGANGFKIFADTTARSIKFTSFEPEADAVFTSLKATIGDVEDVELVDNIVPDAYAFKAGYYYGTYKFTSFELASGTIKINLP